VRAISTHSCAKRRYFSDRPIRKCPTRAQCVETRRGRRCSTHQHPDFVITRLTSLNGLLTASGDDLTDTSDPSRVMMRQIAGSFAQYEKTRLVTKLRGARERIREATGKCEGRKSYAERDPELVLAAKRLHRRSPKGRRRSLRAIAHELQAMGYRNRRGAPYSASCVKSMVEGPSPRAHAG
jgi:hypothetical protein